MNSIGVTPEEFLSALTGEPSRETLDKIAAALADPGSEIHAFLRAFADFATRATDPDAIDLAAYFPQPHQMSDEVPPRDAGLASGRAGREAGDADAASVEAAAAFKGWVRGKMRELVSPAETSGMEGVASRNRVLINELYALFATTEWQHLIPPRGFFLAAAEALRALLVEKAMASAAAAPPGSDRTRSEAAAEDALSTLKGSEMAPRSVLALEPPYDELRKAGGPFYEAVALQRFGGRTFEEVSALMNLPVERVRQAIAIGLTRLAQS